jgi:hypothetical protein
VILPLLISILATLAAAVMSYGVHPGWARFAWGVGMITFARRLQWPLIVITMILCIALLGLIISGKRRAWWLIGLAPVLALFGHRFLTAPVNRLGIMEEPAFIAADQVRTLADDEYVVGVIFNDQAYAYPYSVLQPNPVIVQSDREKRMVLLWSTRANAAAAVLVKRELKARHLEIVSDPADSLLVYNARSGQFIVALTAQTPGGERPIGIEAELPVAKATWRQWRIDHPDTKVLPPRLNRRTAPVKLGASVVLVGSGTPLAVHSDDITVKPLNVTAGELPVLLFRDKSTGRVHAFDRRIEKDLIPQFAASTDPRRKNVFMTDSDSNTGWNAAGVAVDGDKQFRGRRLTPVQVQEDVSWPAAKFWYHDLRLFTK